MLIEKIKAKAISDSRGKPTIEVAINSSKASSPSGKSTGKFETPCWHNSLDWNIESINSLRFDFEINLFEDLKKVEDHIKEKFKLKDVKSFGANALFALESAILKALASSQKKELWQIIDEKAKKLPTPLGNAIGGGLHSEGFENHPTFQEFLLAPKGETFKEKVDNMNSVFKELKKIIKAKEKNDEGAWQCGLSEEEVFTILEEFKDKTDFGSDVASSSFFKDGFYIYKNKKLTKEEQTDFINNLLDRFNPIYLEDPLDEDDFEGFSRLKKTNMISGDDLTVTHKERLIKAIKSNSINATIIKPNQNGSLLEVKEIFDICKKNNIKTILSHRSGETMDSALADYAFGFGADYIKCGISTKWREIKLKRLIEIEKNLTK